jgi:hypothetical protein
MERMKTRSGSVIVGLAVLLISGCAGSILSRNETPGARFDRAMKEFAENCAKTKLKPNDTACDILKLKPADPLATEEGRFAHSIKIPNPLPTDSGYKAGMTPEEYFEHLCKTEAGEFIYRTVEDVDGLLMMRLRNRAWDYEQEHLYAMEDPYGYEDWEATEPGGIFVHPERYKFIETQITDKEEPPWRNKYIDPSRFADPTRGARYERYFGYDGHNQKSLQKEYDVNRKSRYGYTWRGISRSHDRELGIAGGELIVMDLEKNEVLAVKRGFIRSGGAGVHNLTGIWWPRGQVCRNDPGRIKLTHTHDFISKVLKAKGVPVKENNHATK